MEITIAYIPVYQELIDMPIEVSLQNIEIGNISENPNSDNKTVRIDGKFKGIRREQLVKEKSGLYNTHKKEVTSEKANIYENLEIQSIQKINSKETGEDELIKNDQLENNNEQDEQINEIENKKELDSYNDNSNFEKVTSNMVDIKNR